jgi:hypothetical protein
LIEADGRAEAKPRAQAGARRFVFTVLLGVLVAASVELISFAAFWLLEHRPFSYGRLRDTQRTLAKGHDTVGDLGLHQEAHLSAVIHPYVGFVYDFARGGPAFERYHGHNITRYGWIDDGEPIRRRSPGAFIIGITGGSVAYWFSTLGAPALIAELRRHPYLADRKIEIVRMALGGYKQPQQLMALTWLLSLGGELDVLVNLDGYNEIALPEFENFDRGVHPNFPRGWVDLATVAPSHEYLVRVGEVVATRVRRRDWAASFVGSPAQASVTIQLVWWIRDRLLAVKLAGKEAALRAYVPPERPFVVTGPGTRGFTRENLYSNLAEHWARCSRQLHLICAPNGIQYLHFLQPNQYAGYKPMDDEERRVAMLDSPPTIDALHKGYPKMQARGRELLTAGVAFQDLTGIFAAVREPVYADACCHMNKTGNEIMARAVARAILAHVSP